MTPQLRDAIADDPDGARELVRAAVLEEREACAEITECGLGLPACECDDCRTGARGAHLTFETPALLAAAIRARPAP